MIETLSDKRFETPRGEALPMIIDTTYKEEDVKEFIRKLKIELKIQAERKPFWKGYGHFEMFLDKLAGDKLSGRCRNNDKYKI